MDHIKKIGTKIFKKSSAGSKSKRDPKLRYSRSMPLRASNDTEESYIRPRPIYRGQHPLVPMDVEQVVDISHEQIARHEDTHSGWPQYNDTDCDTEGPYHQRYPLIDGNIVDQFPVPPPVPPKTPKRPPRPPTIDLSDYQFDEADLLPEMSPALKAKMDAIYAETRRIEDEANAKAQAEQEALRSLQGQPIQRSVSSASGYGSVRPLNISRRGARAVDPAHGFSNSVSTPQPGVGLYANPAASNSTRSLDPRARYRACLASSRRGAANQNTSQSTASARSGNNIHSNASSQSTQSQHPNVRYRAALASTEANGATPIDDGSVTVRRRNASSASSRSALSARRNGMAAAPSAPYSEQLAHQALGPYHPDVMRVVKTAGGAATVTGYGRHGCHVSRR